MGELKRVRSTELSPVIRERLGLDQDQEVYLKVVPVQDVARVWQKMRDRVGLTYAEMEIAADLGWIDRDQFWHWTPESQAQLHCAEADLAEGRCYTYDTVDALFTDITSKSGSDELQA